MGSPLWLGLDPHRAISAVEGAGLAFDHARGTGLILHMLSALNRDGTMGVTAIGRSYAEAERLYNRVPAALDAAASADQG